MFDLRSVLREYVLGARQSRANIRFILPSGLAAGIRVIIPDPRRWILRRVTFCDVIPNALSYASMIDGEWRPALFVVKEGTFTFDYDPPAPILREWIQHVVNETDENQRVEICYDFVEYLHDRIEKELAIVRKEIG